MRVTGDQLRSLLAKLHEMDKRMVGPMEELAIYKDFRAFGPALIRELLERRRGDVGKSGYLKG
jgi:hypothetical protein